MGYRVPLARAHQITSTGAPLSGALLYVYENGTTTLVSLYSDRAAGTSAANPIVADSTGRFATRYVSARTRFTWVLKTSAGVEVWSDNDIDPELGASQALLSDGDTLTGELLFASHGNIASATTVDLSTLNGNMGILTGTTPVTGWGTVQAGARFWLRCAAATPLTYNGTSAIIQGGASITTAAGDLLELISEGSGNWRIFVWRASGLPVVGSETRNRLINGGFALNQRGAATNADDTYSHDRWYALTQTGTIAVTTSSNPEDGQPQCARLTQSQAVAQRMGYAQIIHSNDCRDLRGQTIHLLGRVRCSSSQAIRYAVIEWTGTANSVTSDVVSDWTSSTFTTAGFFAATTTNILVTGSITPSANTWSDLSSTPITATVGSSANNLTVFIWTEGTAAQNVTLDIGKMKLGRGATPVAYEEPPFDLLIAQCQMYYEKSFELGTVPAQNIGAGTGEETFPATVAGANTNRSHRVRFAVAKRATAPTVTTYSPSAATAQAYDQTAAAVCTNTTVVNNTQSGFHITVTAAAGTAVGGVIAFHWTAESEL